MRSLLECAGHSLGGYLRRFIPRLAIGFALMLVCGLAGALAGRGQQQRKHVPGSKTKSATSREASANPHAELIRENNLGVALMGRQQFEQALEKFERPCVLDAGSEVGCLNMGIALLNMQKFPEARKILAKAADRDPENPRAWYNLGLLDKAEGQTEPAISDFEKAAALDPNDADTQYFIGLLEAQRQQYDRAIAAYSNAIKLNSFHVSAEFGLAQALSRKGDDAGAKDHLDRFQHLTADKLGAPISFIYGEEGKYSLAQAMEPVREPVAPAIPVHFVNLTSVSGLPSPSAPAPAHTASAASPSPPVAARRIEPPNMSRAPVIVGKPMRSAGSAPVDLKGTGAALARFLGSGACVFDFDGDGRPDIFLVNADGKGTAALYRNAGNGRFVNVTKQSGLAFHGEGLGCAVGDYDNDGYPDLAVSSSDGVQLFHNEGKGAFKNVTVEAGIHTDGLVLGMTFLDFDHDGDLDLYLTRFNDFPLADPSAPFSFPSDLAPPGNVLWRNNGNGTFTEWTKETALAGDAPSIGAIGSDINNDRAIDFVVTEWLKPPTVFFNQREGAFLAKHPWSSPMPAATAGIVALDFDKDGWMDLAFTHWGAPGLSLWRNLGGKSFDRVALPYLGWMRGWGVAALDYDNDGWIDLVALGENFSGEGRIALLRNEGPAGFRDVTAETGLDQVVFHNPRSVIAFDSTGDGSADLLVTQNNLPPVFLKNIGGKRNNWIQLAFNGGHDSRTGIGTKVELMAGALQQKWEIPGGSGYLGQGPAEIHAGLGRERQADVIRLLWPTGVLQDEIELAAGKRADVAEIDRRGSSCPIVFVWNGEKFEFLADMIGPGIVGHWIAPNLRDTPDPDEYFKVAGSEVQARDGKIEFRMVEPMEELDYLDQVRLLAVDHPADVEVYPNEYFASNPPFPAFKVIASNDAHPPAGAWDDAGRDVLPLLLERDRQYVTEFPDAPYQGFAGMHTLELDLGPWDASRPLRLLMDGFTDYFSANSMYAAWQAGIQPISPYVEAQDPAGKWVRIIDDMGFPAGLARTMVADLTGKLPPGTRRIRITTNLKIYWDRIRVINSSPDIPFRVTEAPLASARLRFRGYPRVVEHNPRNDLTYIYEEVSATGPYTRQIGNYTRYGEVTELVRASDDKYVIYGSGDEVEVSFDSTHLPDPPAGWTRDYFFYADGFAKDIDFYAAHGDTVAPLPFHTLVPYPYPLGTSYPEDKTHLQYHLQYNTRGVAGPVGDAFRFQYPPRALSAPPQ
jgi:Flp pilus assembly protein TadD